MYEHIKKPWFIPIVLTVIIIVAGQLYTSGKLTKAEALPEQEIRSQLETIYDGEVKELVLDGSVYRAIVTKIGAEYDVEVDASTGKVLALFQTKESSKPDIVMDSGKGEDGVNTEKQPTVENSADQTGKSDSGLADEVGNKASEKPQSNDKNKVQSKVTEKPKSDVNKAPAKPKPASQPAKQEKQRKGVLISEQQAGHPLAQLPAGKVGEVDDVDFVNSEGGGYYLVEIEIDTDDDDDMDEVTYQIHAISGKVMTVTWGD